VRRVAIALAGVLALTSAASAQEREGETYVLVVGVDDYADAKISDLKFAEADARAVADFYARDPASPASSERVKLLLGRQATRRGVLRALQEHLLRRAVRPEDTAILYFAGHGFVDAAGDAYLACQDTEHAGLAFSAISAQQLQALWRQLGARQRILITDACHSGALAGIRGFGGVGKRVLPGAKGSPKDAGRSLAIAAAGANQFSVEDEGHGVFTAALLAALRGGADGDRDKVVTAAELRDYLAREVPIRARRRGGVQDPVVTLHGEVASLPLSRPRSAPALQPGGPQREPATRWLRVKGYALELPRELKEDKSLRRSPALGGKQASLAQGSRELNLAVTVVDTPRATLEALGIEVSAPALLEAALGQLEAFARAQKGTSKRGEPVERKSGGGLALREQVLEVEVAGRTFLARVAVALGRETVYRIVAMGDPKHAETLAWITASLREGAAPKRERVVDLAKNEEAAIATLRGLAQAQGLHRMKHGAFAPDFAALVKAELIQQTSPEREGYRFELVRCKSAPTRRWMGVAAPLVPGVTGARYFAINQLGEVRQSGEPFALDEVTCQLRGGEVVPKE